MNVTISGFPDFFFVEVEKKIMLEGKNGARTGFSGYLYSSSESH